MGMLPIHFYFFNSKIIDFLHSVTEKGRFHIATIINKNVDQSLLISTFRRFLLKTFFISFKSTNFLQVDFDNLTPYHVVDLERKWIKISTYIVIHFENVKSELLYPWKSISKPRKSRWYDGMIVIYVSLQSYSRVISQVYLR